MAMTHKARILAAARKQPVDKLPFGARIDVWYNYHSAHGTLPKKYKDWNMVEILRDQGAGTQLRHMRIWRIEYDNLEVVIQENPPYRTTEWRTPLGSVTLKTRFIPQEGAWNVHEVDYPFRSKEDYPVIEYILENTRIVPDLSEYYQMERMVGGDGMVITGMDEYSPMQAIMRYWIGYERFFYELHDHPAQIERLYELEKEVAKQKLQILAESPVEIPMLCANWSDEFHTPIFRKYFVPWLRGASDYLHARGKLTQVHIDGEMRRLLPFFLETGIDVAEAWSPAPMTSVTTAELRKALGDEVTIWGGIPAVLFEPQYTEEEFDAYIMNLFKEISPGYNFIVGMGDTLPFDGKIERVGRVAELIDKFGRVPMEV
ncbi:MAG TPA: hypothetical protein G4O03_07245 [Dehalococcoidia bacterium]|nr:hypothetical protein [Dehalococcoidia bacterium]